MNTTRSRARILLAGLAAAVGSTDVSAQPAEWHNVLLVTVDTFRPDRLSAYGHTRKTSPHLDSLAADGALFEQAISSSSWTSPGLLSVLTGQWAPTHGVDVRGKKLLPGTPTFATELSRAGYAVPDILYLSSIPNLSELGLKRSWADRDKYLPDGDQVLYKALEAHRDVPFFIYYHYRNLHLPFDPTPPYDGLYTGNTLEDGFAQQRAEVVRRNVTIPVGSLRFDTSDSAWVRALYDGQVKEMDETFIRPLVTTLKRLGLYERTLVIVTADHGEELLDHGFVGHPSTSFKGSAYDELVRIPLMMTCPELIPAHTRIPMQVQNVDILPTVLDLLELPIPESVQGRSLKPVLLGQSMRELPAFTETTPGGYQATPDMLKTRVRAVRTSSWKLIHTLGPLTDSYELYDLQDDPFERRNVYAVREHIGSSMRAALHGWVLRTQVAGRKTSRDTMATAHVGPLTILFPSDGDTLRYTETAKEVAIRWTGQEGVPYTIEYHVGKGAYDLAGTLAASDGISRHGPFTEEMWNMLVLYNPFSFRVVDSAGQASPWVSFRIAPTGDGVPSFAATVAAAAIFGWGEASILVEGLFVALTDLSRSMGHVPTSDVLGWLLVVALGGGLCAPLVRGVGPERAWAWFVVIAYALFIFATLGVMPEVWGALIKSTRGRIDYGGSIVVLIAVVVVLRMMIQRGAGLTGYAVLIPLSAVYTYLLVELNTSPAERFHLAEYGLLSLFAYRALRLDLGLAASCLVGCGIATVAGIIDETIQWSLPNRVFEWKDMGLNALSSALAMGIIATVLAPGDRHNE